jgi:hypothetical protein
MDIDRKKRFAIIAGATTGTALGALFGLIGMLDSAEQAFQIFGVAFAAVCVWLTIGLVNRREHWAKRMKKPGVLLLGLGIGLILMPFWGGCLDSLLWKYDPFFWYRLPWFLRQTKNEYMPMALLAGIPVGFGMVLLGLIKMANARRRANKALP